MCTITGVFGDLAAVIEDLEVPVDEQSLVEAIALRDRLDARIAEATGAFEATGWWAVVDASASMTAWLRAHARMTRRSAQRLRSLAMRLRSLPVCAQAYADGTLSGGQIEAIVALLDDEMTEIFASCEAELVPFLAPLNVAGVSRAMGAWVRRAGPGPTAPKDADGGLGAGRAGPSPPSPRPPRGRCIFPAPPMTAGSSTGRWTPRGVPSSLPH